MTPEMRNVFSLLQPVETEHPLIRLGDFSDGGYLVPDDLRGIHACFSPGVSNVASFEMDLAKRGIRSFLADASVDAPPLSIRGSEFRKKFLGPETKDEFITLGDWVNDCEVPDDADLILQMDIEGAEFDVLNATPDDVLNRFRIIVIEYHRIPAIMSKPKPQARATETFGKLGRLFDIVHIHPNNATQFVDLNGIQVPRLVEVTYLRKDRVTSRQKNTHIPHPLDAPNVKHKPDIDLPPEWYLD